mmetsp:Transcript_5052/g.9234  ORF Transcript_5052/g.9234 Transcript_5052/m.9234 type:complete len:160 (+) Transcript_5052:353-832(+)|eukprot:CAMPEP_0184691522 /NCGR_PEP_ID=MMETSP0313-20130426/351_1 /TAXON_ID=2792 /ORGANISM="Porphyridium aerugineum, Strain SAG 1380-2" /LENGTH=159 /DNA_ID=CAMNT_0027149255 /DNA_START=249 /DNA_END=728 /DNA_ORIENTATION=-
MIGFVSGYALVPSTQASAKHSVCATTPASVSRSATRISMKAYNIDVKVGAKSYRIACQDNQTILEAMEENNIEGVDSSCRSGVCMTCSAKLVSGHVDLGISVLADEAEREGFILACSAMPKSDIKIELNQSEPAYGLQYGTYEQTATRVDDNILGKFFK